MRGEIEGTYLSKNIPYLFVGNHKRVIYSLIVKSAKTYRKINSIPNYERKFDIICHICINSLNIDKNLFLVLFSNMDKTTFVNFGLILSSDIIVLDKKVKGGISV